jgi:tetratricopeptide (TPR) repeat protein
MANDRRAYKPTSFDRLGPAAGDRLKIFGYGAMVFGLTVGAAFIALAQGGSGGRPMAMIIVAIVLGALVFAAAVMAVATAMSNAAGGAYTHLMASGGTTPYKEQYSYQQALVMQGRLDEALESFEAVIAEKPEAIDARIKAAELYARDKGNPLRAAELLREVQRTPSITIGEDVYAANRLVDLLSGPLNDPGRALVELRRLIEKYPNSAAADHARAALAALKAVRDSAR